MYGKELIIDLYGCDNQRFNRKSIRKFYEGLCEVIDMTPCKQTFWDDKWTWLWKLLLLWQKIRYANEPHTKGTSAVQFILTSNITIHTLDKLGEVYINIFSCKDFDVEAAYDYAGKFFWPDDGECKLVSRGKKSKHQMEIMK